MSEKGICLGQEPNLFTARGRTQVLVSGWMHWWVLMGFFLFRVFWMKQEAGSSDERDDESLSWGNKVEIIAR